MPTLVNQTQEVNRLTLNLIVDVEGKRPGPAARKTMRANMVAAASADDLSRLPRDPLVESPGQSLRNFAILPLLAGQIFAEPAAENRLHSGRPKTSANVSPESWPETKSLKRRVRSSLISASVRGSSSRL